MDYKKEALMKFPELSPQRFVNGEIHNWYRIVLGFPDHLVAELIEQLKIGPGQKVLDPFCGTGTTLVECMKRGIDSAGIDANPSSCFAARVKTTWGLDSEKLAELADEIAEKLVENRSSRDHDSYRTNQTYVYLQKSGMIDRGWISPEPLRKAITIKDCIASLNVPVSYKNGLMLSLMAEVVYSSSNMRFGPEIYRGPVRNDADVLLGFSARVKQMAKDLRVAALLRRGKATVIMGDSRECSKIVRKSAPGPYHAVICSPPYPTEHDYTRNSRLELAFLERVVDRATLQSIKRTMIRSHTKGIYRGDNDAAFVEGHSGIESISRELRERVVCKTDGFARLYPTVVKEYFGGMKRHLDSVRKVLAPKAKCAYVLGDQSSYVRVHIPTAEILSSVANEVGFDTIEIKHWRSRWSSATSRAVAENILVLEKRN